MSAVTSELPRPLARTSGAEHRTLVAGVAVSIALHLALLLLTRAAPHDHEPAPPPLEVTLAPPRVLPVAPPSPPKAVERKPERPRASAPSKPVPPPPSAPVLALREAPATPFTVPTPTPAPPPPVAAPPAPSSPPVAVAPSSAAKPAPVVPPSFNASYLRNPPPRYPLIARRNGEQGTVMLRVVVTRDGAAASVALEKTSGSAALDAAALATVKEWRFAPAQQNGQPVEAPVIVPIVFRLQDAT